MIKDDRQRSGPGRGSSRRNFLRAAGVGAAGVAGAAAAAFAAGRTPPPAPDPGPTASVAPRADGPGFDHLVVLMYENRSYDNIFGYLYSDAAPPAGGTADGLTDEHANALADGTVVHAHRYEGPTDEVMSSPRPDPGEEFPHVNTQLFGTVDPAHNRHRKVAEMTAPFNAPADDSTPTMEGFLQDYINTFVANHGKHPTADEYRVAMGAFDPAMLPVFSTLARNFAIYDAWHCAVPSQTFGNRSFFHASTSHGFVTNSGHGGYKKWLDASNSAPTIFNRLSDAGIDWVVYYDERQLVSMTGLIHAPALEPYFLTNFRTMSRFYEDVRTGKLPAYSFLEPRMLYDHNDMHPPVGPLTETDVDGRIVLGGAVSDVRAGEALLSAVYSAIRDSASPTGSNAGNTMLLVTFDEHGGTFDHVPPPRATPPDLPARTEMGFRFDRLGVRVPALAISAYTPKGAVLHDAMHHGSVISTLTEKYGLPPLTARDAGAPTLASAIALTSPRDPASWPSTTPAYVPTNPERNAPFVQGSGDRPLSPPGVGLVGMLVARYGRSGEKIPATYREAYDTLQRHGRGIFGRD
ncbi:alkaline phosphatase family protein [Naasia sp. SYSU D00948]|uniref:alkaline phosphatase family protein n=1 Tax=Naasia sp. SYSU D00948 TaxID=2817379 RepID=UPI001B316F24|nr:alkaline phosphatase family protein [Naasia sp. SYSU D00948]